MKFSLYALIVAIVQVTETSAASADDFTPIAGDYGSVDSVVINPSCPDENPELPSVMFTVTPSDTAQVSTYPADVVTATVDNRVLTFKYNNFESTSGGG